MAALGMIEVYGYATSIVIADLVAKTADVKVVAIDKHKPGKPDAVPIPLIMAIKFTGNAGAVRSALDAAEDEAKRRGLYVTSSFIGGLDERVEWFANLSATGRDKLRNMDLVKKNESN